MIDDMILQDLSDSMSKQVNDVYEYLLEHKTITSNDAIYKLRCTRLAAVIWKLRHIFKLDITTQIFTDINEYGERIRWAVYTLHV